MPVIQSNLPYIHLLPGSAHTWIPLFSQSCCVRHHFGALFHMSHTLEQLARLSTVLSFRVHFGVHYWAISQAFLNQIHPCPLSVLLMDQTPPPDDSISFISASTVYSHTHFLFSILKPGVATHSLYTILKISPT